jgi:sulfur-carrier protein
VVHFTAHIARHLACPPAQVEAGTVRAALEAVFHRTPALRSYVLDDQGRLRRHVNVFINGDAVVDRDGLSDTVAASDELFVLQALSGG